MGKTFKDGIVISFANLKGGVGKSTLTSILANSILTLGKEEELPLRIAVLDADDAQISLFDKRQDDLENLNLYIKSISDNLQQEKELLQKNTDENLTASYTENIQVLEQDLKEYKNMVEHPYDVIKFSSADVANHIDYLKSTFDIILIDLPGNMDQKGVYSTYYCVDIFILPFETSYFDMKSTQKYYDTLVKNIVPERKELLGLETTIYGIFNRVKPNTREFKDCLQRKDEFPFPIMETFVKDRVQYNRNINTIGLSVDENEDEPLLQEVMSIIMKHLAKK